MPFCGDSVILAEYDIGVKINPLKCRRWSCPDCCETRKSRLRAEAYRGKPNTFITLTTNPAIGNSPSDRAKALAHAWRKVRRQACKGWKNEKIPFMAVFEETEKGEPHIHIVARLKWIDQDWLSKRFEEEIGAPNVDIRRINSQKKAARYISKYVGKDPEKWDGVKRYWRSLDYFVLPAKKWIDPAGVAKRKWFERASPELIIKRYERMYYRLERYELPGREELWMVDAMEEELRRAPPKSARTALSYHQLPLGLGGEAIGTWWAFS